MTGVPPLTTTWSWGNSVDPLVDPRGDGLVDMTPEAVRDFALERGLTSVHLSVPWAAGDGGPIETWLASTVGLLHGVGCRVTALGGDLPWLRKPGLAAQWAASALVAAPFDGIQLDLEPWVAGASASAYVPQLIAAYAAVRGVAPETTLGADLPWWLATTSVHASTAFDVLIAAVDSAAIIAFADHAAGDDGIIALAAPAAAMAAAAGRPFTIGVETDTPDVAGGAQYTFHDEGSQVLEREAAKVSAAFAAVTGYSGVAVEHLRSWRALPLGPRR